MLIAGGASGFWWQRWKQERVDQTVSNALAQVELLERQAQANPLQTDRYHQALETARAAAKLAEGASAATRQRAEELVARLEREEREAVKDRELRRALLEVRSPREGLKYKSDAKGTMMALAEPTAEEQFTKAFREWGLDVDTMPVRETVAILKTRPKVVVMEVIAALTEWASERRRQGKPKAEWQRLAELAASLDDDPSSKRRELRELLERDRLPMERALGLLSLLLRPVPIPVEELLGPDRLHLLQLAKETDPAIEPILGLLTMVRALRVAGEERRAEAMLRDAIRRGRERLCCTIPWDKSWSLRSRRAGRKRWRAMRRRGCPAQTWESVCRMP